MTNLEAKISGLESRLHRFSVNWKENSGVAVESSVKLEVCNKARLAGRKMHLLLCLFYCYSIHSIFCFFDLTFNS